MEAGAAAADSGAKRILSTPGSGKQARKKERTRVPLKDLTLPGFTICDCGAEGACGFNCISVGAALVRGQAWDDVNSKCATMGSTLRVHVAQHIGKNAESYRPLWALEVANQTDSVKEDGDVPAVENTKLLAIRRHKRWICGLTIKAAATRLGVQIVV